MTAALIEYANQRLLVLNAEGPILSRTQDLLDLIQQAFSQKASVLVVPVQRMDPAFFQLRAGLAGEFVQKVVNYQLKLVIVGDISAQVAASDALRDFVREANRGQTIFFVSHLEALSATPAFSATPPKG
jgi:Domain of unknown function (DUF4180)